MSIRIDQETCAGCALCRDVCPGNLIAMDHNGKAYLKHPFDCWGCTACMKTCRHGAVEFVLDPELDGAGETLKVRKDGTGYIWEVLDRFGRTLTLRTDTRKANGY